MLKLVASVGFPAELSDLWTEFPADAQVPIADAAQGEALWLSELQQGLPHYPNLLGPLATTPWAEAMCAVPLRVGRTSVGALGLMFQNRTDFEPGLRQRIFDRAEDLAGHLAHA